MPFNSCNFIRTIILFATVLSADAFAVPISYLFHANVNGSLNGAPVAGAFTLTAFGDTTNVTLGGTDTYRLTPSSVVIDLAGQVVTLNAGTTYVFDNQSSNKVGFGVNGIPSCCDIIQHQRSEYGSYDLKSAIGPLTVASNLSLVSFGSVPTSGGLLTLTFMESNSFQAIVGGDVPEPGSIALLSSGTLMLLLLRRRTR